MGYMMSRPKSSSSQISKFGFVLNKALCKRNQKIYQDELRQTNQIKGVYQKGKWAGYRDTGASLLSSHVDIGCCIHKAKNIRDDQYHQKQGEGHEIDSLLETALWRNWPELGLDFIGFLYTELMARMEMARKREEIIKI